MSSRAEKFGISHKFSQFEEQWRPKVVAELNGQEVNLVKVQGAFPWHTHAREDELFLVWRGEFRIEFRDRVIELTAGEAYVVPHGMEHRTVADSEAEIILFEPADTRNTGDIQDARYTAPIGIKL